MTTTPATGFGKNPTEMKLYLYHCRANGPFGPFGDYVWASNSKAAAAAFEAKHKTTPTFVKYEHS